MTEMTQLTDRATATRPAATQTTINWLEAEFSGWTIDLDESSTWGGDLRPLWIARKEGHHPQAELTAAKLHTRLSEYLNRADARRAMGN